MEEEGGVLWPDGETMKNLGGTNVRSVRVQWNQNDNYKEESYNAKNTFNPKLNYKMQKKDLDSMHEL